MDKEMEILNVLAAVYARLGFKERHTIQLVVTRLMTTLPTRDQLHSALASVDPEKYEIAKTAFEGLTEGLQCRVRESHAPSIH